MATPSAPSLPPLVDVNEVQRRLVRIFGSVGDEFFYNLFATRTVFALLYVGAVDAVRKLRPSMVYWMRDAIAARVSAADRNDYYEAARRSQKAVDALLAKWGVSQPRWYADTSRESIRDNCLRNALLPVGAVGRDMTKAITSSVGVWWAESDFAALFDPALTGAALEKAIASWQSTHLTTVGKARTLAAARLASASSAVSITVPGTKEVLSLPAGEASEITRAVIVDMAPKLIGGTPAVLFVASSADPVPKSHQATLASLGITLDERVLPDVVMFDPVGGKFWFVEVVASNGPITEARKADIVAWASAQGIASHDCRFVSAYPSRTFSNAKKRLPDFAWDSVVWFYDEPDKKLTLDGL